MSEIDRPYRYSSIILAVITVFVVVSLLLLAIFAGIPTYSRWNSRAHRAQNRSQALKDANNEVTITNIKIGTTKQKVSIAQQEAAIRFEQAKGIRESQDEIAKTLTPLYVQFELSQALKDIALSGRNNSVIYIPIGPNGLPIVQNAPTGGK